MQPEPLQTSANPLGTAPIGKLLPKFAIPSVIAFLVSSLYNIVDQIFIGQGSAFWQCGHQCGLSLQQHLHCDRPAHEHWYRGQFQSESRRRS